MIQQKAARDDKNTISFLRAENDMLKSRLLMLQRELDLWAFWWHQEPEPQEEPMPIVTVPDNKFLGEMPHVHIQEVIREGPKGEPQEEVEKVGEALPHESAAVLAQTLVVEPVYL